MKELNESIKKWEAIVNGTGEDNGIENCALCQKYHANACDGCPVYEYTGFRGCKGSPHEEWGVHMAYEHRGSNKVLCDECLRLAKKELAFLKEVLKDYKERK